MREWNNSGELWCYQSINSSNNGTGDVCNMSESGKKAPFGKWGTNQKPCVFNEECESIKNIINNSEVYEITEGGFDYDQCNSSYKEKEFVKNEGLCQKETNINGVKYNNCYEKNIDEYICKNLTNPNTKQKI